MVGFFILVFSSTALLNCSWFKNLFDNTSVATRQAFPVSFAMFNSHIILISVSFATLGWGENSTLVTCANWNRSILKISAMHFSCLYICIIHPHIKLKVWLNLWGLILSSEVWVMHSYSKEINNTSGYLSAIYTFLYFKPEWISRGVWSHWRISWAREFGQDKVLEQL